MADEKTRSRQSEAAQSAEGRDEIFQGSAQQSTHERGETQDRQSGAERAQQQAGGEPGQQQRGVQERRGGGAVERYGRNPFAAMQELSDEMDRLFDSFFYGTPMRARSQRRGMLTLWMPEVDICEQDDQLRICVDLPGVSKDDVKIDIREGVLIVRGERREERSGGGQEQGFRRSERQYGSFYRAISLPDSADTEKAEARMEHGVLNITIPISEEKQPRRLQIQS
jgi:HSP20 family protein